MRGGKGEWAGVRDTSGALKKERVNVRQYIDDQRTTREPTKKPEAIGASPKGQFSKNTVYLERGIPYFAFVGTNAVLVRKMTSHR